MVNIKLRHDYKGVQAQVGYGNTLDKDSGEIRANVVFGIGDGNTNVTGVIDYYHRNSIFNRDRGYSAVPIFLSTNSTPENLSLTFDQVVAAGGTPPPGFGPVGKLRTNGIRRLPSIFFGHAPFGSNGLSPASAYTYTAARSSFFNFNQFSSSYPQIENYGGFVAFDHKWFGDQVVIYGDLYYQNATSHDELAPSATGSFQTRWPGHSGHPARYKSERRGASGNPDLRGDARSRPTPSTRLIRSIRSSRVAAGLVSSNLATVSSTTPPIRSSSRSVPEATNCLMEHGVMISDSVTAR